MRLTVTKQLLLSLCITLFTIPLPLVGSASPLNTATQNTTAELLASLSARPRLCMTSRQDRLCIMEVELSWEANKQDDFCIYSSHESDAVACWSAQLNGEKVVPINSDEDINYRLVFNKTEKTVAEATVSILNVKPKNFNNNRRRRHAWSIF